jgi:hypothetical protein
MYLSAVLKLDFKDFGELGQLLEQFTACSGSMQPSAGGDEPRPYSRLSDVWIVATDIS